MGKAIRKHENRIVNESQVISQCNYRWINLLDNLNFDGSD